MLPILSELCSTFKLLGFTTTLELFVQLALRISFISKEVKLQSGAFLKIRLKEKVQV